MSEFNISVESGKSVRLPTAGKYCDRDIVVSAEGTPSSDGTAIPIGKKVYTVYFNDDVDVSGCLQDLTYYDVGMEYPVNMIFAGEYGNYLFAIRNVLGCDLLYSNEPNMSNDSVITLFKGGSVEGGGWHRFKLTTMVPDEENGGVTDRVLACLDIGSIDFMGDKSYDYLQGVLPVGAENDKLKNFISITPFCNGNPSGDSGEVVRPSYGTIDLYDETITEVLQDETLEPIKHEIASVNYPSAINIGKDAFCEYYHLTEVDLPSVTSVGSYAFSDCHSLENLDLPLVTSVGASAFDGCYNLTNINLPLLTSVGDFTFYDCFNLVNINLPLVTSVGGSAFIRCHRLTNLDLPLVTSVGDFAFANCYHLTNINLPLVTSVGMNAFDGCRNLTTLNLPLITSVGIRAFRNCSSLETLIVRTTDTICVCDPSAFDGTKINGVDGFIYIPSAMWDYYASAYGDYIAIFRKIEDYPEICG